MLLEDVFQESNSQSTNTGFKSFFITDKAVEIIEKLGIITSDPFFNFKDFTAISRAAVPLETLIANFLV